MACESHGHLHTLACLAWKIKCFIALYAKREKNESTGQFSVQGGEQWMNPWTIHCSTEKPFRGWQQWQVCSWGWVSPHAAALLVLLGPPLSLSAPAELVVTIVCCVQVSRRLWWPVWTNKLGRLQTKHCVLAAVVLHSCWSPVAWTPAPQGRHNFKWPQTLLPFSLEKHTASSMPFLDCRDLHSHINQEVQSSTKTKGQTSDCLPL